MTSKTVGTTTETKVRLPIGRLRSPRPLAALLLALLMLPLAACGVTSTSGGGTRSGGTSGCDPTKQWKIPSDNVNLEAMSLAGSGEAWAVGAVGSGNIRPETGVIYHHVPGQTPAWQQLPQQYPGADLSAIAMDSPTDGWAASTMGLTGTESNPLVLHYTGGSWHPVDIPALDAALKGPPGTSGIVINWITLQMFGPDAGWLFASTNAPRDSNNPNSRSAVVILHYENGAWTPIAAPSVADSTEMFSLSAVSADEAWIVGTDYGNNLTTLFAHYRDGAWSIWPQTFPGVTERFTMLSPSDGWAFDSGEGTDTLLHYDGTSWSVVALPADWAANNIRLGSQVFAAGPGTRWFVLANESSRQTLVPTWQIAQYASGTWHTISLPFDDVDPVALAAVPGSSSKELVGVGNILHQEGCPPMNTGAAAQGVFLDFAAGSWTRDVLP